MPILSSPSSNPASNPAQTASQDLIKKANALRIKQSQARATQGMIKRGVAVDQNVVKQQQNALKQAEAADANVTRYVSDKRANPSLNAGQYIDTSNMPGITNTDTMGRTTSQDVARMTGGQDYSNVFKGTGYRTGQSELGNVIAGRDKNVQTYMDQAEANKNLQANTFTRLFGADSRLAEFYNPTLKQVQNQISGLTGDLENLDTNISSRFGGAVLTDAQRAKIGAQERAGLTNQLDDMTRAQARITDALNLDKSISEAEFNATINDANNYLQALQTQYEQMGMPQEQINFITNAVANQFNREATAMAEQIGIAGELRGEARTNAMVDKDLSANTGYMTNAEGQYLLDDNFQPIPYNSDSGGWEWKTVGKSAYAFDPRTREAILIAGPGGSNPDGGSTSPSTKKEKYEVYKTARGNIVYVYDQGPDKPKQVYGADGKRLTPNKALLGATKVGTSQSSGSGISDADLQFDDIPAG